MRKMLFAVVTAVSVAALAPHEATAAGHGSFGGHGGFGAHGGFGGGFPHRFHGFGPGFGVGFGFGYPYYGYYPYYYDYEDDGGCYVVRRRVHTRHGWRYRPVSVCE